MKNNEVCKLYRITRLTLSLWAKSGKIKYNILPSGRYDYIIEQPKSTKEPRLQVIYSRVSTSIQKENLARQTQRLKEYCSAKGVIVDEVLSDVGSALNYNRKNYIKLLELVVNNKVETIFIEYKDRLLRIGFEDFERICKFFNTNIVIIDNTDVDKSKQQEITEDLVSIIHHFSMRIYSSRKRKKIIDLVKQDADV